MARVMRAIHSKLVSANLIPLFDADPDCFFKDARSGSYHIERASSIDDSLFNSVHHDPALWVINVASIPTLVFDEFALHTMDINFENGKTEFLLDLLGPGSNLSSLVYCLCQNFTYRLFLDFIILFVYMFALCKSTWDASTWDPSTLIVIPNFLK